MFCTFQEFFCDFSFAHYFAVSKSQVTFGQNIKLGLVFQCLMLLIEFFLYTDRVLTSPSKGHQFLAFNQQCVCGHISCVPNPYNTLVVLGWYISYYIFYIFYFLLILAARRWCQLTFLQTTDLSKFSTVINYVTCHVKIRTNHVIYSKTQHFPNPNQVFFFVLFLNPTRA